MKTKILAFVLLLSALTFAQSPNIAYSGVQNAYAVNTPINLSPVNNGGLPSTRIKISTLAGQWDNREYVNSDALISTFLFPQAVTVTADGSTVYVTDSYISVLRKIKDGKVSEVAGSSVKTGYSYDYGYADGTGKNAKFNNPFGLCTDKDGNVYEADTYNNRIRKTTPAGVVTTVAGNGTTAVFNLPWGICIDNANANLYVTESAGHKIKKVNLKTGTVTLVAGSTAGFADGANAKFKCPIGICIDAIGNLYVSDKGNAAIRKITAAGVTSTLFTGLGIPMGICIDKDGVVYFADSLFSNIYRFDSTGVLQTYAGLGSANYKDGFADKAYFYNPESICVDANGIKYVGDRSSQRVRKVEELAAFEVYPALPKGLVLNPNTGVISGSPLAPAPFTIYTVMASNYKGSSITNIAFQVN